jgi:hypothetical protein
MKGDAVPCRAHGSYGPGDTRTPPVERREAPASAQDAVRKGTAALHGAPLPQSAEGKERDDGLPGAAENTGDESRASEGGLFEN